ncbi:hypothetical protein ACQP1U_14955 [Actinomycetota bacterium]
MREPSRAAAAVAAFAVGLVASGSMVAGRVAGSDSAQAPPSLVATATADATADAGRATGASATDATLAAAVVTLRDLVSVRQTSAKAAEARRHTERERSAATRGQAVVADPVTGRDLGQLTRTPSTAGLVLDAGRYRVLGTSTDAEGRLSAVMAEFRGTRRGVDTVAGGVLRWEQGAWQVESLRVESVAARAARPGVLGIGDGPAWQELAR